MIPSPVITCRHAIEKTCQEDLFDRLRLDIVLRLRSDRVRNNHPETFSCPPRHSDEEEWIGSGVQRQTFSSEYPLTLEMRLPCRYNGGFGGGSWKTPDLKSLGANNAQRSV